MIATGAFSSKRDPLAAPGSSFIVQTARFQFLTSRFLRMEWTEDGRFEDRASLAVVNRNTPPVDVTQRMEGGETVLETEHLTVRYFHDGRPFHEGNLSVTVRFTRGGIQGGVPDETVWKPGRIDCDNLGGTLRTLDRMNGAVLHYRAPNANPSSAEPETRLTRTVSPGPGLVSRSGWALYDDSGTACVESRAEGLPIAAARPEGERTDRYFFGYGHDYRAAVKDAATVFGAQPLPPRFAFGYWWSRFWAYTDTELESLLSDFERADIPLSVLVVDMDWHLEGWTGFTWDTRFFPDPDGFLSRVKEKGIRVSLNIHPHEGVSACESAHRDVALDLGLNPETADRIPFDVSDPRFMESYFNRLHRPLERKGVDFWWLDWQQGETSAVRGLDPLPWLNRLYWEDAERSGGGKRPLVFSRYGGPGSGRYPIGFSGDTYQTWESLSYQPYFTSTAANVLYGYWSHDIGGHFAESPDPELYLRWLQWGLYSPVLRTHAQRHPGAERRVWEYPEPYGPLMRETIRERHRLIPYIYTEARKAYETGLSLCRPLYYDLPDREEGYANPGEYFFGDSLLVAPVTKPVSVPDGTVETRVRLPDGPWIDTATGALVTTGTSCLRRLPGDIPVFVRPGTILPRLPDTKFKAGTGTSYPSLSLSVWAGGRGSYTLYEDDGLTNGYLEDGFVRIGMEWEENDAGGTLTVLPPEGGYEGFSSEKDLEIRLHLAHPPTAVEIDGKPVTRRAAESTGNVPFWSYTGDERTVVVRAGTIDLREGFRITFTKARSLDDVGADAFPGVMKRLREIMSLVRLLFSLRDCHPGERMIVGMAQTGRRISLRPETCAEEYRKLANDLTVFPGVLGILRDRYEPGSRERGIAERALALFEASGDVTIPFIRSVSPEERNGPTIGGKAAP